MHTSTVVIQIGNTDNKLTQGEWSNFVHSMHTTIASNVYRIHFRGGSDWDAPWQNGCWVCEVTPDQVDALKASVAACRKAYRQDAAAFTAGQSEFI